MMQETQETREPTLFAVPLMMIMVAVTLFIALLNGQKALILLSIIVLIIISGARLWSHFSLKAVSCTSSLNKTRAFPGQKIVFRVEAVNAKFLPVWIRVMIPPMVKEFFLRKDEPVSKESGILWQEKVCLHWNLTAAKRGIYSLGPIHFRVSDLMGFFPRETVQGREIDLIVYPKVHPLKDIYIPPRDLFGEPGERNPVRDPLYLLGTREYQSWSPARYIHWKASARHSLLQEKVFQPSEQKKVLLALELNGFPDDSDNEQLEKAIETIASLAVHLEKKGSAVGLVTDARIKGNGSPLIPVARNPRQTSAILETLAGVQVRAERNLADTIEHALRLCWGITCIYFAYETDAPGPVLGNLFRRRKIPVLSVICKEPLHRSGEKEVPDLTKYYLSKITIRNDGEIWAQ